MPRTAPAHPRKRKVDADPTIESTPRETVLSLRIGARVRLTVDLSEPYHAQLGRRYRGVLGSQVRREVELLVLHVEPKADGIIVLGRGSCEGERVPGYVMFGAGHADDGKPLPVAIGVDPKTREPISGGLMLWWCGTKGDLLSIKVLG